MILRYPEDLHERRHGIVSGAIGEDLGRPFLEVDGGPELRHVEGVEVQGQRMRYMLERIYLDDGRQRLRIWYWPEAQHSALRSQH